ncbi:hypothetical protein H072_3443 [Dactylellina haptotyla CBS 200.50]|uniref:Uncharacterized protein n=1 Tax=Dactylellina haptotyla (strain CBS 200.50) TaxID=1284197 RepID=S8AN62_DACHA|nr:hypothetical protein H072_3443 [Dactylellina haptotyla CBS 200.50]
MFTWAIEAGVKNAQIFIWDEGEKLCLKDSNTTIEDTIFAAIEKCDDKDPLQRWETWGDVYNKDIGDIYNRSASLDPFKTSDIFYRSRIHNSHTQRFVKAHYAPKQKNETVPNMGVYKVLGYLTMNKSPIDFSWFQKQNVPSNITYEAPDHGLLFGLESLFSSPNETNWSLFPAAPLSGPDKDYTVLNYTTGSGSRELKTFGCSSKSTMIPKPTLLLPEFNVSAVALNMTAKDSAQLKLALWGYAAKSTIRPPPKSSYFSPSAHGNCVSTFSVNYRPLEITFRMSTTQTSTPSSTSSLAATSSPVPALISSKYGIILAGAIGGLFILISATLVFIGLRVLLRERRKRDMQVEMEGPRRTSTSTDSTDRTVVDQPMVSSKAFQV